MRGKTGIKKIFHLNRAMLRNFHNLSRSELEKRLGGGFVIVEEAPERRYSRNFATWRGPMEERGPGIFCFAKKLGAGRVVWGKTWGWVAYQLGV